VTLCAFCHVRPVRYSERYHRETKYCSLRCLKAMVRQGQRERRTVAAAVRKFCAPCGQWFEYTPIHGHRRKYCSKACSRRAWLWQSALRHLRERGTCDECGKPLPERFHGGRRRRFCSRYCSNRYGSRQYKARRLERIIHGTQNVSISTKAR